ncbi:MAG: O-antigen ligase family protein, partial [candidate division WOR-3 bacterium]
MLSVLVAVGILFSLSRAGILSAVISVLCFIAFAAKRAGFRSHTVALLIIILGVFSVAASIGVQMVIHVTKEAVTGESTSWLDRFDLNRSGLVFFKEFFLVGSGLGTFGSVFPRFQSARFGDRWADFLHNDWLQLFCEMGVVGGGVLLVGLGRLVHGLIKKSRHVRDPFCLWVGFGCLVGVMSILLHSFFDYNLGKVNSNAVLFTVLLGMCFVLFQLGSPENREASGSGRVVIRLRGRGFLRASVAVAGTCVLPAAWIIGVPGIVADLQFNGYLSVHPNAGKPDDYFFLPTGLLPAAGADGLREAIKAEPENPVYWFAEARCIVGSVKEEIRKRAESDAYRALNMGSAREGIAVQLPNEVVEAFSRDLWSRMGETLSSSLVTAAASLRKAIELCPTVAEYHVLLTDLLLHVDGGAREAIREAEVAGWLAPNKPSVLFQAGKTFLIAGVSGAVTQYTVAESIEKAYMCFRKVLYSDPAYAYRVFELVTAWQGDKADLLAITPLRTRARESLARWLEERWDWKVLLVALEQMDGMVGTSVDDVTNSGHPAEEKAKGVRQVSEEAPPGKGSRAYDGRPPDEVLLSIVGKRCFALGALNEWRMRGIEIARYRKLVRAQMDRLVEEAIMLQESGRMREAIGLYMEILDKDWSNPRALLGIAEAMKAGDGGVWEMADETNPLDYLYRLLVYDEPLDKQVVEKARRCAVGLNGSTPGVRVLKEFLIAGFCLKAGEFDRTIQLLSSLANEPEEVLKSWRQYHQIWYLLGKACEAVGDLSMACQSYQKVVEIVPTHMAALRKLASLREERDEAVHTTLRQLVPAVECDVTYGGKLVWLGYTLGKEKDTRVGEMTYYWEFLDGFDASYQPAVHFCDAGGRILFQNDHRIMTGNGP